MLTAVAAYFAGSIPTGYLLAKARGIDIRSVGSGNIGATNVFRILGKPAGITVLLLDALKGFVAARLIYFGSDAPSEWHAMLAGFCAILGHNYTIWLRFKGGKGIATSAGVLLALVPGGFIGVLAVWIIVFVLSKYVSLASIFAAATLPLAVWLTGGTQRMIILGGVLGGLALYKHKANFIRLMNGTEHRFGEKKST
ncbi:MAG: glycerol-3-phosphate 1-O-acyltransferase PlsY [Verrucomicrobiota bacterium]|nr:glycerol-3-phosphate 1-O-acyltransferase PlsY [Verrucomicrobiota bacterium]